jgi:hypothetical protein
VVSNGDTSISAYDSGRIAKPGVATSEDKEKIVKKKSAATIYAKKI